MGRVVNQEWAAKVLGMRVNQQAGPDLIDDDKIVEIKFNLIHLGRYSHRCWRILEPQSGYAGNGTEGYWGLGFYTLSKPISAIRTKEPERLEALAGERELYLVAWDWMNQFVPYHERGKTAISEWDNHIRFAKFSRLPKVTRSFKVKKGRVYFTEGVDPSRFGINSSD